MMQPQKNLDMEVMLTKTYKSMWKQYTYYYAVILCIVCVVVMSGCVGNMPSSIEVAAQLTKTVYNKCSDLDKWDCLWYDKKY